jgi:hypothetical protein
MGANAVAATSVYLERIERVRSLMAERGVDVLLLSVGHDLPYLTGYLAMPLERLTMLVLPQDGDATLVVPRLEAPRVHERPDVFGLRPWGETEDPISIVASLVGSAVSNAVVPNYDPPLGDVVTPYSPMPGNVPWAMDPSFTSNVLTSTDPPLDNPSNTGEFANTPWKG